MSAVLDHEPTDSPPQELWRYCLAQFHIAALHPPSYGSMNPFVVATVTAFDLAYDYDFSGSSNTENDSNVVVHYAHESVKLHSLGGGFSEDILGGIPNDVLPMMYEMVARHPQCACQEQGAGFAAAAAALDVEGEKNGVAVENDDDMESQRTELTAAFQDMIYEGRTSCVASILRRHDYPDLFRRAFDDDDDDTDNDDDQNNCPVDVLNKNMKKSRLLRFVNWIDEVGNTALHVAADRGDLDMLLMLLTAGADVEAKDDDGGIPLHSATREGHVDICEVLLRLDGGRGANIVDHNGTTPFHNAALISVKKQAKLWYNETRPDEEQVAAVSDDSTYPPSLPGRAAVTAMPEAPSIRVPRLLLAHGGDPLLQNNFGLTARGFALKYDNTDMLAVLDEFEQHKQKQSKT